MEALFGRLYPLGFRSAPPKQLSAAPAAAVLAAPDQSSGSGRRLKEGAPGCEEVDARRYSYASMPSAAGSNAIVRGRRRSAATGYRASTAS